MIKNKNNIYLTILSCKLNISTENYARIYFVSKKLSAQMETTDVELLKFGEPLTGDPEPSSLIREGVETLREAPKVLNNGEEKVQTTKF